MEHIDNNSEVWQIESAGDVRDLSFDELTQCIAAGELLRIDRVKKSNLRWIEAGKVPALAEFFKGKDLNSSCEPVLTKNSGPSNVDVLGARATIVTTAAPSDERKGCASPKQSVFVGAAMSPFSEPAAGVCAVHSDTPAAFVCGTCGSAFCKACPNSYGPTVKICPFCGAMCKSLAELAKAKGETQAGALMSTEGFGISDFFSALAYPFKYPVSLIFGALMFAFFSVGQGAAGFGGAFMLSAAIVCFMCANMLSFGVLANVVENFTQGKTSVNFMPSFDDFNIWDDVVHPFFLSIGVYISSFGPLAAVFLLSIFLISGVVKPSASSISPEVAAAPGQVQQGQELKNLIAQQKATEQNRIDTMTDATKLAESQTTQPTGAPVSVAGGSANASTTSGQPTTAEQEEQHFQKFNDQINQARKAQLEGAIGKTSETQAAEQKPMFAKILGYGAIFLICAGIALMWGLFYLPAACCVAGYTRSFTATLNPTVGLDTIRRLGSDYAKLLFMGLIIGVVSLIVSGVLAVVFNAFALPGVGNVPAKFFSSLVGFYLSVVFSITLGLALYKAGDRLHLPT
jgi:hypothetical protein